MMGRRNRNPRSDYLQYIGVIVLSSIVSRLPWWVLRGLARVLGRVIYALGGRHRKRVLLQMKLALGHRLDEAGLERLALSSFQHLMMLAFETLCMHRISRRTSAQFATSDEVQEFATRLEAPCIAVTGHFGGFQHFPSLAAMHGCKMISLQRPLDNPYLDTFINRQRSTGGAELLSKFDSLLNLRRYAREKYVIGMVMDQNGGKRGIFADFLGFPASTWTSAAELHYVLKLPLHVVMVHRVGLGPRVRVTYRLSVPYDPRKSEQYRRDPEAREQLTREIVEQMNLAMGEAILENPEQWLWQHRRWKERPKGETIPMVDGVPCPWLQDAAKVIAPMAGGASDHAEVLAEPANRG